MKERFPGLLEAAKSHIARILREESGQDLVEYSLLLMLIALVAIATVDRFGDVLYATFVKVAHAIVGGSWDYR